MESVLRDACDTCHRRKIRCPTEAVGACSNCRKSGQVCVYSPRSEMGRPRRKRGEKQGHASRGTASGGRSRKNPKESQEGAVSVNESRPVQWTEEFGNEGGDIDTSLFNASISFSAFDWTSDPLPMMHTNPAISQSKIDLYTKQMHQLPPNCLAGFPPTSPDPSPADCYPVGSVHLYMHLSRILFALRGQQHDLLCDPHIGIIDLDKTFRAVSSLCDLLQHFPHNRPRSPTGMLPQDHHTSSYISPCLMLKQITITTVLEIYRSALVAYKNPLMPRSKANSLDVLECLNAALVLPLQIQPLGTHHIVAQTMQFASMDLHLSIFLRVCTHIDPSSSKSQDAAACSDCWLVQELRDSLLGLMKD